MLNGLVRINEVQEVPKLAPQKSPHLRLGILITYSHFDIGSGWHKIHA